MYSAPKARAWSPCSKARRGAAGPRPRSRPRGGPRTFLPRRWGARVRCVRGAAPPGGEIAGRGARPRRVALEQPLRELRAQIVLIDEAALLEETALDPADEVFNGPFLLRGIGPADLNPQAQVEHDAREDGVPLRHLSILPPLEGDSLRPIKHRQQWNPAKRSKVIDQRPSQRLRPLIPAA